MNVQAVLFGISDWSADQARKWLYIHNYIPIKRVYKTSSFLVTELLNLITQNASIASKQFKSRH